MNVGTRWLARLLVWIPTSAAAVQAPFELVPVPARTGGATTPVTQPAELSPDVAYIDWSARQLYAWGIGNAPKEVPLLAEAFPFSEEAAAQNARDALRVLLADSSILGEAAATRLLSAPATRSAGLPRTTLRTLLARLVRTPERSAPPAAAEAADAAVIDAIEQALTSSRAAQTSFVDDGSVKLQMRLPLDGGRGGLGEAWVRMRRASARHAVPPRQAPPTNKGTIPTARPPTGIVVQARGLGATPTLWPQIVRSGPDAGLWGQRSVVYDQAHLSDEMLRAYGVAPFVRSIEAALRDPRVADRAMLVRAIGCCPDSAATLRISDADADAIEAEAELLREGRVIIVID